MKRLSISLMLLVASVLLAGGFEGLPGREQIGKQTISLDLKNTDADDVFKIFSEKMGVNIVRNRNVDVRITIRLKDVPILEAFDLICRTHNLAYTIVSGVVQVYNLKDFVRENGVLEGDLIVFRLSNSKSEDVYKKLIEAGVSDGKQDTFGAPIVISDDRINAVKIIGRFTPAQRSNIIRVLRSLDIPTPQVLLEAKIVSVRLTKDTAFGIRWNAVMDKFKIGLPMQQGVSGFVIDGALSQGRMSVDMLVDALATEGEVRTLSSPRMVVANNEEAKIIEGKNEPYKEISKDVQGNSIESWKFIEVGIGMTVTPHVFEDSVELTVHPQISQSERTGGYEVAPVVVKSDLQTTVRVKDGATLVLGGLIQEKKNKTTVGIPYLMKIPFLGRLFSKKNNYDERYEIVFFITPTILK